MSEVPLYSIDTHTTPWYTHTNPPRSVPTWRGVKMDPRQVLGRS
jgi:hypothetical protein